MKKTLGELAVLVGGRVSGDQAMELTGVSSLELAQSGEISFLHDDRHLDHAKNSRASAVVIRDASLLPQSMCIVVDDPYGAFVTIMEAFAEPKAGISSGIHPTAIVHSTAMLGTGVCVGAYTVIEDHVSIGADAYIAPLVYIGRHANIGEKSVVYPHVAILERVRIGKRVIIHSGTVIGSDGFGYVKNPDRSYRKVPQLGTVEIDDDVELGSNVSIDRATFGATRIGRGTKIDNLVQVGHNDDIGAHAILVSQVGLSGSVRVGDRVVLAGQAGVRDHVTIGDDAVVLAQAGVKDDVKPATSVFGTPARDMRVVGREMVEVSNLSALRGRVKELEHRLKALEVVVKASKG